MAYSLCVGTRLQGAVDVDNIMHVPDFREYLSGNAHVVRDKHMALFSKPSLACV